MNHARGAAVLLLLSAAVGCTSEADAPERPASSPPATTAGVSPDPLPTDTVAPPQLGSQAGTYGPARGDAAFRYAAGTRDVPLSFSFECQGTGTLQVRIPVLRADFPVECDRGELVAKGADFDVPAAHLAGTVHVTAPPGVTWAGAVGRGEPEEEPSVRQRGPGEGS
ncbi:hypothetical protein ACH3WN_19010 [Streptomyces albogriseolus]|uniref:hypothetical protein n=1 Tax=Streptomyces albogriseolus TaxID=1887 RepID=UPI003792F76A